MYIPVEQAVGIVTLALILGFLIRAPSAVILTVIALAVLAGPDNVAQAYSAIQIALVGIIALTMAIHYFRE